MTTPERLREYATQLLAMAIKAREDGDEAYADELTAKATELLDQAAVSDDVTAQPPMPQKRKEKE
jgi:hypothetical protein